MHTEAMTFDDGFLTFSQEIAKQKLPKDEFTRANQGGGLQRNGLVVSSAR